MILALTIGVLTGGAIYLLLDRTFLRVVLGFVMLSHAVNLIIFAAGGSDRRVEPLGSDLDPAVVADALPQAFVLTAIVIAFSITVYLLVLAVTGSTDEGAEQLTDPRDLDDDRGPDDASTESVTDETADTLNEDGERR